MCLTEIVTVNTQTNLNFKISPTDKCTVAFESIYRYIEYIQIFKNKFKIEFSGRHRILYKKF